MAATLRLRALRLPREQTDNYRNGASGSPVFWEQARELGECTENKGEAEGERIGVVDPTPNDK